MQMHLEIDNNFFPQFKAMIDNLVKDNKVSILDKNDDVPESVIISSVEEVRRRVSLAEERIKKTGGLTEDAFWGAVDKHLDTL